MKFTLRIAIAMVMSGALIYTACKKDSSSTTSQQVNEKIVSSQVAINLSKSLSGAYGGVNINEGLSKPSAIVMSQGRLQVNDVNPICGYKFDNDIAYDINIGDTIKSKVTGKFAFTYNCTNDVPDGYTSSASLTNIGKGPGYGFLYSVIQAYVVKSLNAGNTLLRLDGGLTSIGAIDYTAPGVKSATETDIYVLIGLKIDLSNNADIVSGTTTFSTKGSNAYGKFDYKGTIKFLGNHMAKITINGKSYNANLLTGEVTEI